MNGTALDCGSLLPLWAAGACSGNILEASFQVLKRQQAAALHIGLIVHIALVFYTSFSPKFS
jgi:uncharacterized membrane protein